VYIIQGVSFLRRIPAYLYLLPHSCHVHRQSHPNWFGRCNSVFCPSQWLLGVGLWPLACCDCGFESHWGHGYLLCYVFSGRGLCDDLITRPEESCRLWCVVVCDIETSSMRRSWPNADCRAKQINIILGKWPTWRTMILGNCPNWRTNSFQCLYLFIVLSMFRACHGHHQEKHIVSIQLLVIVTPCWWQCRVLVGSKICAGWKNLHTSRPPT